MPWGTGAAGGAAGVRRAGQFGAGRLRRILARCVLPGVYLKQLLNCVFFSRYTLLLVDASIELLLFPPGDAL